MKLKFLLMIIATIVFICLVYSGVVPTQLAIMVAIVFIYLLRLVRKNA